MRIPGLIGGKEFLELAAQKVASEGARPATGNKYGAQPVQEGHDQFDSKHEADIITKLRHLQQGGYIKNLVDDKRGLKFPLIVNEIYVAIYEADARFEVVRDFQMQGLKGTYTLRAGEHVVLDAKSHPTRAKRDYGMKRDLVYALYGKRIVEV